MTTIRKKRFDQLVRDFEYERISRCRVGEYTISWQPIEKTCFMFHKGQVIETGGFEHILEQFLEDEKE